MKVTQWMPLCQIIVCVAAAIGYGVSRDLGRFIYWTGAATLTFAVTFVIKD